MNSDEFLVRIYRRYDIPIEMIKEMALQLYNSPPEEQDRIRDRWAEKIMETCPPRRDPLEGREDLMRGMMRNDLIINMYYALQIPDEVISELKKRTEGKTDAEIDEILITYLEVFKKFPRRRRSSGSR